MDKKLFCQMEFTRDREGKELLLKDGKFQVMMEWEKPYMEACIDALGPRGDVLEIGFGCGYASTHIQTYKPRSHTIIEYHPFVAAKAREWAKKYSNITIVEDTWQNAMKSLDKFDAIFFDDYPLESEQEGEKILEEKKNAHAVLESGQKVLAEVHQALPELKTMTYKRADIDDFLKEAGSAPPEMFLRFFSDLKKAGQIDEAVWKYAVEKGGISAEMLQDLQKEKEPFQFRHQGDRLFSFLQLCLEKHMNEGAVFSCYLEESTSKFEDEKFFNQIITNPFLEYKEHLIPVEVPEHCVYFRGDEALVMTIKKMGCLKDLEDRVDLEDAKSALADVKKNGAVSWEGIKKRIQ